MEPEGHRCQGDRSAPKGASWTSGLRLDYKSGRGGVRWQSGHCPVGLQDRANENARRVPLWVEEFREILWGWVLIRGFITNLCFKQKSLSAAHWARRRTSSQEHPQRLHGSWGAARVPRRGQPASLGCGPEPEESRTRGAGRKRALTGQSWPSLNKK